MTIATAMEMTKEMKAILCDDDGDDDDYELRRCDVMWCDVMWCASRRWLRFKQLLLLPTTPRTTTPEPATATATNQQWRRRQTSISNQTIPLYYSNTSYDRMCWNKHILPQAKRRYRRCCHRRSYCSSPSFCGNLTRLNSLLLHPQLKIERDKYVRIYIIGEEGHYHY